MSCSRIFENFEMLEKLKNQCFNVSLRGVTAKNLRIENNDVILNNFIWYIIFCFKSFRALPWSKRFSDLVYIRVQYIDFYFYILVIISKVSQKTTLLPIDFYCFENSNNT